MVSDLVGSEIKRDKHGDSDVGKQSRAYKSLMMILRLDWDLFNFNLF
jgi:hypothetical protein